MTTTVSTTSTQADIDAAVVRAGFMAFAGGDLPGFLAIFALDATDV